MYIITIGIFILICTWAQDKTKDLITDNIFVNIDVDTVHGDIVCPVFLFDWLTFVKQECLCHLTVHAVFLSYVSLSTEYLTG